MKYHTQKISYYFFAASLCLMLIQTAYGFILGFAHIGYDVLHEIIPFNIARASHTNLVIIWILMGFMGSAYYIIPEESENELVSPVLAYVQLIGIIAITLMALCGFHFEWWEGRKFLEIPRSLDVLFVADFLLFLGITGLTILRGRKTMINLVLFFGLLVAALLYFTGMINTDNQTLDTFWRWWVVHFWVEGTWMLIMISILSFLLMKLNNIDRNTIDKWIYFLLGIIVLTSILGIGHHFYYIGAPPYWLWIGGIFSALESLVFLGIVLYVFAMSKNGHQEPHPNRSAILWTFGCALMAFAGAGILGVIHTLPLVNLYSHGTLITAMHSHMAFWGAYAMLVFAMIEYALPMLTERKVYNQPTAILAFWTTNLGIVIMVIGFAIAGITQIYLERKIGMDFITVQEEIETLFISIVIGGGIFSLGVLLYVYHFFKIGPPASKSLTPPINE